MKDRYYAIIEPVAAATTVSFLGEYGWYKVKKIIKIDDSEDYKETVVEEFD